jgi:hypothetical protein
VPKSFDEKCAYFADVDGNTLNILTFTIVRHGFTRAARSYVEFI